MMLAVDPSIPLPVYEQIREQIVRMVTSGTLHAGHRLPTIRQLAIDLGIAKGTVARAYDLLESESVIETRGRQGSFVVNSPQATPADRAAVLARAAETLAVIAKQSGADIDETQTALTQAWQRL